MTCPAHLSKTADRLGAWNRLDLDPQANAPDRKNCLFQKPCYSKVLFCYQEETHCTSCFMKEKQLRLDERENRHSTVVVFVEKCVHFLKKTFAYWIFIKQFVISFQIYTAEIQCNNYSELST